MKRSGDKSEPVAEPSPLNEEDTDCENEEDVQKSNLGALGEKANQVDEKIDEEKEGEVESEKKLTTPYHQADNNKNKKKSHRRHHHHHWRHDHQAAFDSTEMAFSPCHHYQSNHLSSLYFKSHSNYYANAQMHEEFTNVRKMEQSLLRLLTDFQVGKLHAFGEDLVFENMVKIREQQENLARFHFELNLQQSNEWKSSVENHTVKESNTHLSSSLAHPMMSKPFSKSNMLKLIQNLQNLCKSIERFQIKSSD